MKSSWGKGVYSLKSVCDSTRASHSEQWEAHTARLGSRRRTEDGDWLRETSPFHSRGYRCHYAIKYRSRRTHSIVFFISLFPAYCSGLIQTHRWFGSAIFYLTQVTGDPMFLLPQIQSACVRKVFLPSEVPDVLSNKNAWLKRKQGIWYFQRSQ